MEVRCAPWLVRRRRARRDRLLAYRRSVAIGAERELLGRVSVLARQPTGAPSEIDVAVRQRLLDRVLTGGGLATLRRSASGRRVGLAMPGPWVEHLEAGGTPVSRRRSRWRWAREVARALLSALASAARLAARGSGAPPSTGPHAVALSLPADAVSPAGTLDRCDFTSWIAPRLPDDLPLRAHVLGAANGADGPVSTVHHPLPALAVARRVVFAGRAAALLARALVDASRGRWWSAWLARDGVEVAYLRSIPTKQRPTVVIAHNGSYLVRPLWTHEVERAGGIVELVFYATNIEHFERDQVVTDAFPGYELMSWPRCLVWDEQQAAFVEKLGTGAEVEVVGPVDFVDGGGPVPDEVRGSVAVFDVTPQDRRMTVAAGRPVSRYYSAAVVDRFLDDVFDTIAELGLHASFKQKRDIGRTASVAYRTLLAARLGPPAVVVVEPSVSARRMLEHATAAISLPFTSTALIARELGVPSAFYDPTAELGPVAHLGRGVTLLQTRSELRGWLRDVVEGGR